tara:strand:- start:531 stop:2075 length:1545 start_codon:yes stop_codon:yes gene_type:complete
MSESINLVNNNRKENKEKLILLLLNEDLRKKFMKTLVDRLYELEVTVAVDDLNYPEEKQRKFFWILNFPCDIPKGKAANAATASEIFRVTGSPKIKVEKPGLSNTNRIDKLIHRYNEIQKFCKNREKNLNFIKLALADAILRSKREMIQKFENLKKVLEKKISEVEKPYFKGIGFILSTSIEKITGVAVLDGLMKGLVHVMIIDDLEKRTIDGLVALNFKRKFLTYMSTKELSKKIDDFQKEHSDDEFAKANIAQFIFNSPDFENVEIVFFNSWKFTDDSFPIRVALRKKTILSKKEERKMKQKNEIQSKIDSEELRLNDVKEKLNELMSEIKKMEKSHFDDEDEYQLQNNKRRRLLKDIKIRELRIKEMKRPVKKSGGDEKIITFDLFEIFKSNQSFMDRIGDTAGTLGIGEFWGKHIQTDESNSFNKLSKMAHYSREWIKVSSQINKINSQSSQLEKQLDNFVEKKGLKKVGANSKIGEDLNYQSLLDEHILDNLELAVLRCEISNLSDNSS